MNLARFSFVLPVNKGESSELKQWSGRFGCLVSLSGIALLPGYW